MENTDQLKTFLSLFAINLPALLVCFVAGIVILGRWRDAPGASLWALLGFGLLVVLCFVIPLVEVGQREGRMWALTAFGIVGSVLRALIYAFLLAAIYSGRPKAATQNLRG